MGHNLKESAAAGKSVTLIGALVNAILILLKFIAGILGHSQALVVDAVHSISDLFTDAVVLVGLKMGRRAPDETHHFGHARIETMASAMVGLALIATALYLGIKAAWAIYVHREYHPSWVALVAAGISIAFKEALYHYTVHVGQRIKSSAVVANAWHHRSDALSSVAVLLGVAGAQIRPGWHVLDAYAALVVSFFIVKVALDILRQTLHEFTDTAPDPDILRRIRQCALDVEGVMDTHDLRVRTFGGLYQMETHIVVDGRLSVAEGHRIAKAVEKCLLEEVENMDRVIVHMDPAMHKKEQE